MIPEQTFLDSVATYYNKSQKWYTWFYSDTESLGLHYGFWEKPDDSRAGALVNPYRAIQRTLSPRPGETILDAGCGVGGASLWLAANTGAAYVGITISQVQLHSALRHRKQRGLEESVSFFERNYFDTKFEPSSFDKVFGLESFCYSYPDSSSLYTEMHRVLKPGGRLMILDGIFLRKPKEHQECQLANDFCKGFRLAAMNTPDEIVSQLSAAGFKNVVFTNKTAEIKPSVNDLYAKGRMVSPFRYLKHIGLVTQLEVDNLLATNAQKELYESGIFGYGIFTAEK